VFVVMLACFGKHILSCNPLRPNRGEFPHAAQMDAVVCWQLLFVAPLDELINLYLAE